MRWRSGMALAVGWIVLLTLGGGPVKAQPAEEYVVGPEDVLSVSVWVHPELDRSVTVTMRGTIMFPPIGEVQAAGMTPRQLSERLSDRLSTYLRQTTMVTVTISQYMSRSVLIAGAVTSPGRIGFERIPGVLDVLSRAGGALPTADLARVQVLRREGGVLKSLPADLKRALDEGSAEGLPTLQPGDILMVPAVRAPGEVAPDAVGVLGQVHHPGLYGVGEGQELWMLLAQAGGPTDQSDLTSVKILPRDQDVRAAVTVNLLQGLQSGRRSPHVVRPGDIVYLNPKRAGLWGGFTELLAVTRDVLNLVVLSQVLQERK